MRTLLHAVALGQPNATGPPGAGYSISRTTTESSAKNRSAAVLTTTTPSMETIMATTTSDSACGRSNPRIGTIVRHRSRHDPRARSGEHHGFRAPHRRLRHRQRHGVISPRPLAKRRYECIRYRLTLRN